MKVGTGDELVDKVVHYNAEFSRVYREAVEVCETDDLLFVAVYDEDTGEMAVEGMNRAEAIDLFFNFEEGDDQRLTRPAREFLPDSTGPAFWLMVGRTTDDDPYLAAVAAEFQPMTRGGVA